MGVCASEVALVRGCYLEEQLIPALQHFRWLHTMISANASWFQYCWGIKESHAGLSRFHEIIIREHDDSSQTVAYRPGLDMQQVLEQAVPNHIAGRRYHMECFPHVLYITPHH